jgi:tetratricopeptide (TPR) repeat protein
LTLTAELKQRFPDSSDAFLFSGDIYSKEKKSEQALNEYRQAALREPPHPMLHIKIARLLYQAGLTDGVQEELRNIDQWLTKTKNEEFFLESATLYLDLKQYEKAYILAKALQNEIAPRNPAGFKLEALVLIEQNRTQEAAVALENARKLASNDESILENLAVTRLKLKDTPGTTAVVNDWLAVNPNSPKALLLSAYLKYTAQNYKEAYIPLETIIQNSKEDSNSPVFLEALNLMGQVQLQLSNIPQAQQSFERACQRGYQPSCDFLVAMTNEATKQSPPPKEESAKEEERSRPQQQVHPSFPSAGHESEVVSPTQVEKSSDQALPAKSSGARGWSNNNQQGGGNK